MQALWFLIDTLASFLAGSLLLRGYMNWLGLRGRDPLSQFIFAITDWCVLPLRKMMPAKGRWDLASFIAAMLVAMVAAIAFNLIVGRGMIPMLGSSLLLALSWLIKWTLYTAMMILLMSAVLSWVNPQAPMAPLLNALTRPILEPIRRVIPLVGGVDLSPMVAIIAIQVLLMLSSSLFSMGWLK
jgi:YggT family protein